MLFRLADVKLKDVKRLLKAKRHYRYQFRNHDPQIGFVKEEVCAASLKDLLICLVIKRKLFPANFYRCLYLNLEVHGG